MTPLRSTWSPSSLAGGEQVILLHTAGRVQGAQKAAETLPAADTGAEAATPVSGATGHALSIKEKKESKQETKLLKFKFQLNLYFLS